MRLEAIAIRLFECCGHGSKGLNRTPAPCWRYKAEASRGRPDCRRPAFVITRWLRREELDSPMCVCMSNCMYRCDANSCCIPTYLGGRL